MRCRRKSGCASSKPWTQQESTRKSSTTLKYMYTTHKHSLQRTSRYLHSLSDVGYKSCRRKASTDTIQQSSSIHSFHYLQGGPIKNKQISNYRNFKSVLYFFFKLSASPLFWPRVIGLKNDGNWTMSSEDMRIFSKPSQKLSQQFVK